MKKKYQNPEIGFESFDKDVIALSYGDGTGEGGEIGWGDIDLDLIGISLPSGPVGDKYVEPVDFTDIVNTNK